ncbi:uncharacterized protein LAESUDRAFT_722765 [Laetiporus sulphureus 93-53]|uniref:Uncharacterized protein n=1 Tax=Laetiporus sulphureus 93-53 TaxID=1314785 RepID=A0A165G3U4_9APHY|nr:uncharacterized protein LAESUDRAFT_722765 [Laetiporus sulphureus 93-53]KZT09791.1 hypothetical protein LAESUDRAFT_722765 [Laetiporus sulphureus 93-53]
MTLQAERLSSATPLPTETREKIDIHMHGHRVRASKRGLKSRGIKMCAAHSDLKTARDTAHV